MQLSSVDSMAESHRYHVIVERDEDGYFVASVVELPGCHTQARFQRQLGPRIREAIEEYLGAGETSAPQVSFVGIQTVEV